jgi:arylsulfatase A-like enzyme
MGWRDLSCSGSTFYETPNIDALAAEGYRFTDAYASAPVCSPTRASILTGQYPARVGLTNFLVGHGRGRLIEPDYAEQFPPGHATLAEAMRQEGYATWHVGKWHLGGAGSLPEERGFEVNRAGCEWGLPKNGFFSPWGIPNFPDGEEREYLTDRLTSEAIDLIRTRGDRPFYLNMWYYSVHIPIQAKEEAVAYFREKAKRLGLDKLPALEVGEHFPVEHKKILRVIRRKIQSDPAYAAMISHLDENIGRLLEVLREEGIDRDTHVIFTSDNGGLSTSESSPTSNLPLAEGKGWMYEGGNRVPLIVRPAAGGSARARQGEITVPSSSPDLYPTILELCDLPARPRQHVDGASLVPSMRSAGEGAESPSPAPESGSGGAPRDYGDAAARDALFWHFPHYGNQGGTPSGSVRAGRYKLVEFYEDGRTLLFDLVDDPGESRDISAQEPERSAELARRLAEWRNEVGASMPEPNPDFIPWS